MSEGLQVLRSADGVIQRASRSGVTTSEHEVAKASNIWTIIGLVLTVLIGSSDAWMPLLGGPESGYGMLFGAIVFTATVIQQALVSNGYIKSRATVKQASLHAAGQQSAAVTRDAMNGRAALVAGGTTSNASLLAGGDAEVIQRLQDLGVAFGPARDSEKPGPAKGGKISAGGIGSGGGGKGSGGFTLTRVAAAVVALTLGAAVVTQTGCVGMQVDESQWTPSKRYVVYTDAWAVLTDDFTNQVEDGVYDDDLETAEDITRLRKGIETRLERVELYLGDGNEGRADALLDQVAALLNQYEQEILGFSYGYDRYRNGAGGGGADSLDGTEDSVQRGRGGLGPVGGRWVEAGERHRDADSGGGLAWPRCEARGGQGSTEEAARSVCSGRRCDGCSQGSRIAA